ncbi:putative holin [Collimonas antrihumi]|uniref:putative holin n=1 Tax=Collimonas antrihumi TaxID=1940615 RepID=UPI001B8C3E7B|nr:putative holin [Collimonas antrihumi]
MHHKTPRLTLCLVVSLVLMLLAYFFRQSETLLSISFYKAHLLSLGGWGGYWIDRAVFPYARPHVYLERDGVCHIDQPSDTQAANVDGYSLEILPSATAQLLQAAFIRRAIIIGASLICAGLAA